MIDNKKNPTVSNLMNKNYCCCNVLRVIARNTNDVRVYNVRENVWSVVNSKGDGIPPQLSMHVAVIVADYMIIHGMW